MVRRGSHPRLSVILVVEGSPSYAMRALESIQNQDLYDLQIVVVCRDVAPGVRHSLQVAADRDIHIDLIDVEDAKRGACLRAGFDASRGSQIIAMNLGGCVRSSMLATVPLRAPRLLPAALRLWAWITIPPSLS